MPIILILQSPRQEDCELKAILSYTVSPRPVRATKHSEILSQKRNKRPYTPLNHLESDFIMTGLLFPFLKYLLYELMHVTNPSFTVASNIHLNQNQKFSSNQT